MVKVVRAERDFQVDRQESQIVITSLSKSRTRAFLSVLLYMFFGFALAISLIVSFIYLAEEGGVWPFTIVIGSGIALWLTAKWAGKKLPSVIAIDREGIIKDSAKYLFEDIDALGWRFGNQSNMVQIHQANSFSAAGATAMNEVSGVVEIDFGDKRTALITGLSQTNVEKAYDTVKSAMQEMGYVFQEN